MTANSREAQDIARAAAEAAEPAADPAAELARENADLKDKLLRTLADMENLRRRTNREVADARNYGIARFGGDLLGVADNMRRAPVAPSADLPDHADPGAQPP